MATNLLNDPSVNAVVINYHDITDRKRAEEEIRSLAKFPSENSDPVLRLSPDGIVMYANAASQRPAEYVELRGGRLCSPILA